MKYYKLLVIDALTGKKVQTSDPHTWEELETIYNNYKDDYFPCIVHIFSAKADTN